MRTAAAMMWSPTLDQHLVVQIAGRLDRHHLSHPVKTTLLESFMFWRAKRKNMGSSWEWKRENQVCSVYWHNLSVNAGQNMSKIFVYCNMVLKE